MNQGKLISVPGLVRIKPGALQRLGLYLRRAGHGRVLVLASQGLPEAAELGSVCAAFCVASKGTQEHSFSMAEFNASLTAHFGRSI